ncbi:hypothetical protein ACTXJ8_04720 [Corynebacterium variabile]|uniref:hypothetical protein n=1 Tax=Corynebacterium variabile TaxID=1727 RepID=UPI003FD1389D
MTNPDPTAQAKLRTNRNEYAVVTSCTPDPDDNVYRTADHFSRTLDDTHLEALDTESAELLTPTRPSPAPAPSAARPPPSSPPTNPTPAPPTPKTPNSPPPT